LLDLCRHLSRGEFDPELEWRVPTRARLETTALAKNAKGRATRPYLHKQLDVTHENRELLNAPCDTRMDRR